MKLRDFMVTILGVELNADQEKLITFYEDVVWDENRTINKMPPSGDEIAGHQADCVIIDELDTNSN